MQINEFSTKFMYLMQIVTEWKLQSLNLFILFLNKIPWN